MEGGEFAAGGTFQGENSPWRGTLRGGESWGNFSLET